MSAAPLECGGSDAALDLMLSEGPLVHAPEAKPASLPPHSEYLRVVHLEDYGALLIEAIESGDLDSAISAFCSANRTGSRSLSSTSRRRSTSVSDISFFKFT